MYIPSSADEIAFATYNGMTPEEQRNAFWEYVNDNEYLSEHKGQYAERYGHVQPWIHRFDAKLLQDIFATLEQIRNTPCSSALTSLMWVIS